MDESIEIRLDLLAGIFINSGGFLFKKLLAASGVGPSWLNGTGPSIH